MTSELTDLEQAIAATPDDESLRRVYADALEERGDPRAEHIVTGFRAHEDREALQRLRELDEAASARLTAFSRHIPRHVVRLRWRLGLIERIDVEGEGTVDLEGLIALVDAPECCALRELDLRGARCDVSGHLDGWLARRPIRWLGIAERHASPARIATLLEKHPRVDGLGVVTHEPQAMMLAIAGVPLRELDIAAPDAGGGWLPLVVEHRWPLVRLVVEGGFVGTHAEVLESVLRGEAFPALTAFGAMSGPRFTVELLDRLGRSPLLHRLTALGMRASTDATLWLLNRRRELINIELFTSDLSFNNGDEWWGFAGACMELGHHAEACAALEACAAHQVGACSELAVARLALGDGAGALSAVDRALADEQLDRYGRARAWRTRARAYAELARDREAIEACNTALDLEPDAAWTYQFLGTTLRKTDRRDAALDAFAKAVCCTIEIEAQRGQQGHARMLYGNMLWSVRRRDEAIVELAEATRSGDAEAARQAEAYLGWMAHQRGDLVEARERLERASDVKGATDKLASVCFDQGEFLDAYEHWYHIGDYEQQGHALIALGRADEVLEVSRRRARACALYALGRVDEAIAALDEHGPYAPYVPCMYRRAAALLLQGLWGRDTERLARAMPAEVSPVDAYLTAIRELPGAQCTPGQCGRRLATTGAIAALALGRGDEARARASAVIEQIDGMYATETLSPMWELRAAIAALPEDDRELARRLVRAAEQCVPDSLL